MSINGAMMAGVSGLTANAAALSTISQNIANVNTVGYKRASTEFATVVNAQTAGVNYSAGGVQPATSSARRASFSARPTAPTWPSPARASSSSPKSPRT